MKEKSALYRFTSRKAWQKWVSGKVCEMNWMAGGNCSSERKAPESGKTGSR